MLSVWKLNIECFHRNPKSQSQKIFESLVSWLSCPLHTSAYDPFSHHKHCQYSHCRDVFLGMILNDMISQRSHFPMHSCSQGTGLPEQLVVNNNGILVAFFLTRSLNCHFSFKLMFSVQNIKAITFWIWQYRRPWIICFYFHIVFNMYQRLFLNAAPVVLHSTPKTYVMIRRIRLWASSCVPCSGRDCLAIQTFQMASALKP